MSDDITPARSERPDVVAAVTDGAYTLLVADFNDTESAWTAYEALKSVEDQHLEIEGVVVVKREADGTLEIQKATDHSTKSGLKWGIVGGVVLGVVFPPSIIGSAAALGAAGAAAGKIRQRHHRGELADQLENAIAPGHSGILALVSLTPAPLRSRRHSPWRTASSSPPSATSRHATSKRPPRTPRSQPAEGPPLAGSVLARAQRHSAGAEQHQPVLLQHRGKVGGPLITAEIDPEHRGRGRTCRAKVGESRPQGCAETPRDRYPVRPSLRLLCGHVAAPAAWS